MVCFQTSKWPEQELMHGWLEFRHDVNMFYKSFHKWAWLPYVLAENKEHCCWWQMQPKTEGDQKVVKIEKRKTYLDWRSFNLNRRRAICCPAEHARAKTKCIYSSEVYNQRKVCFCLFKYGRAWHPWTLQKLHKNIRQLRCTTLKIRVERG